MGLKILRTGYTYHYFGSLAYEIERLLIKKSNFGKIVTPFLSLIAMLDFLAIKNKGNFIWVLAKK
jgi:hypothetical protein